MAFPATILDLRAELLLGGAWTNIISPTNQLSDDWLAFFDVIVYRVLTEFGLRLDGLSIANKCH